MIRPLDKGALSSLLSERIGELATELLGQRTVALSSRNEWRWRAKGSLCLAVAGSKVGSWFDHEAGVGGDTFALIQRERGCSFPEALAWAADWVGPSATIRRPVRLTSGWKQGVCSAPAKDRSSQALRLWAEAYDPADTPAEHYLRRRGLELPDNQVLRFRGVVG